MGGLQLHHELDRCICMNMYMNLYSQYKCLGQVEIRVRERLVGDVVNTYTEGYELDRCIGTCMGMHLEYGCISMQRYWSSLQYSFLRTLGLTPLNPIAI